MVGKIKALDTAIEKAGERPQKLEKDIARLVYPHTADDLPEDIAIGICDNEPQSS